jgi:dihydroceramide fatty acyl 2-hydroxylase
MMKSAVKNHKAVVIFKNPYLEKMSHIHPLTPFIFWAPPITYFLWKSFESPLSVSAILSMGVAGLISWTFVEYILHRFLFHYEGDSAGWERAHFILHGHHHIDANAPTRLMMPPLVSVVLGTAFYYLFDMVFGPVMAKPFFAFFVLGYLCYDYTHYYVHFFTPTTRLGKFLKSYHMKHHYSGSNSRWGVSSPLWDYIFGTTEETLEDAKPTKVGP